MYDSLQPHESQHARPPCPTPTPGVHWDSCPLSQWCHPAISSSVWNIILYDFSHVGKYKVSILASPNILDLWNFIHMNSLGEEMAPYCKNAMRFLRSWMWKKKGSEPGGRWSVPSCRSLHCRAGDHKCVTQLLSFCLCTGKMSMSLPNFEPPPAPPLLENQIPNS